MSCLSSCSPRSILKRKSHTRGSDGAAPPVVHFPPSPVLTRAGLAHSPASYDRTPIAVEDNNCALPERGCPGRTYALLELDGGTQMRSQGCVTTSGRTLHPRAIQDDGYFCSPGVVSSIPWDKDESTYSMDPTLALPALVPDLSSSESDESDGLASPSPRYTALAPSAPLVTMSHQRLHGSNAHPSHDIPPAAAFDHDDVPSTTLRFLPHASNLNHAPSWHVKDNKARVAHVQALIAAAEDADDGPAIQPLSSALASCPLDDADEGCLAGF
jgi:hypothetical protein